MFALPLWQPIRGVGRLWASKRQPRLTADGPPTNNRFHTSNRDNTMYTKGANYHGRTRQGWFLLRTVDLHSVVRPVISYAHTSISFLNPQSPTCLSKINFIALAAHSTAMGLKSILSVAAHVAVLAFAAGNTTDASTFVFRSSSSDQTFVFALNAVKATGDLYFHLEAPAGQAWAAVGIGSEMKDSLIFAAYASENGTGVTVSPRIATRHSEPSYAKDVDLQQIWPAGLNGSNTIGSDGRLRADAVCRNCTSWLSGNRNLDLTNTAAPFIFAVGPSKEMRSSSLTASMRRHDFYGHFTMNMTAATSSEEGTVPLPNSKNGTYELHGASEAKDMTADSSHAPAAHALIMIAAFVFLFPLGSLVLKVLHKALWHGIVQILAVVLITVGFGLGIHLSTQYNKVCRTHHGKTNDHSNAMTNPKTSPNPSPLPTNSSASSSSSLS
jgi:hypothetical protein